MTAPLANLRSARPSTLAALRRSVAARSRRIAGVPLALVALATLALMVAALFVPTSSAWARGFKSSSFRSSSSRSSWSGSRSSYRGSTTRSAPSKSNYAPRPSSSTTRSSNTARPSTSFGSRSSSPGRFNSGPLFPSSRRTTGAYGSRYRSGPMVVGGGGGLGVGLLVVTILGIFVFMGAVVVIILIVKRSQARRALPGGGRGLKSMMGPPPGPPPGERNLDPDDARHWQALLPGDQVTITDVIAFSDALEIGRGSIHGSDYKVAKTTWAVDDATGRTLTLALLDDPDQPLLLVVDERAGGFSLRLLHRPMGAPTGTRADLLDAEAFWLFQPPPNPDRFAPSDLRWTLDVIQDGKGPGGDEELRFDREAADPPRLRAASQPVSPDGEVFPLQLVEFRTQSTTADPWLVALETGGLGTDVGGWVEVWQGCEIGTRYVSLTPGGFVGQQVA